MSSIPTREDGGDDGSSIAVLDRDNAEEEKEEELDGVDEHDGDDFNDTGGSNPGLDVTVVLDDEVDDVINGGESTEDFNFASALALRKNLTAAFDKHAPGSRAGAGNGNGNGAGGPPLAGGNGGGSKGPRVKIGGGGVRSKIAKLEKKAGKGKERDGGTKIGRKEFGACGGQQGGAKRSAKPKPPRFAKKQGGDGSKPSRPRPPKIPSQSSFRKRGGGSSSAEAGSSSLLTVYLRIRPPVAPSTDNSSATSEAAGAAAAGAANTIEIIGPGDEGDKSHAGNRNKPRGGETAGPTSTNPTTIRTYPPESSNAARVVRVPHPHPSSDVIFGDNSNGSGGGGDAGAVGAGGPSEGGSAAGMTGVKEYEFSRVFGPASTQEDVYGGVAAPLVGGMFPPPSASGDGNGKEGPANEGEAKVETGKAPLVGQSALLFAYGITNAGKTHTIVGSGGGGGAGRPKGDKSAAAAAAADLDPDRGVIPRALHDILGRIKDSNDDAGRGDGGRVGYNLSMSYFEVYNEQVFDLIGAPDKKRGSSKTLGGTNNIGPVALKLRESRDGKIFVKGLTRHRVATVEQGLDLARRAMTNRHTSSNNINSDSSRSHSICQLELLAHPPTPSSADDDDEASADADVGSVASASGYTTEDEAAVLRSKENRSVSLWIVDLAGSERAKRTGAANRSARQKEAALINSSLMKLMRCLHTLRDNQSSRVGSSSMVPFRESKLTYLFMNHLTGASASRTSMIVNVNPSASDYDETQHVLSYATVARSIVISEDDYDRKRRAVAMGSSEHTHDDNGRSLSRARNGGTREKSPPRKIARLASKLSPRSMLAKRREQQADAQKRKAQLQSMRGESSRALPPVEGGAAGGLGPARKIPKLSRGSSSKELEEKDRTIKQNLEEINRLRSELAASRDETASARSDVLQLREQLCQREGEIRMELAEEMEAQMKAMRQHYNTVVDRLKQQLNSQPTPGKSAKKVQLDKAEQVIEELMDQVEECEEDMARQRAIHEEQIERLMKLHEEAVAAKDSEIADLKEILDDYDDDDDDDISTSTESPMEENKSPAPHMVKRLPRQRASEVACSASPPPSEPKSSSKKGGLFRSKIASPGKKQENRQPLSPLPRQTNDGSQWGDGDTGSEERSSLS